MKTKIIYRLFFFGLVCLFACFNLSQAYAVNNTVPDIDSSRYLSLRIAYLYKDKLPVRDVEFNIYQVADLQVNNGGATYILKADFSKSGVDFLDMTADESMTASNKLYEIAQKKGIKPLVGKTDYRGEVRFGNLNRGMYLVIQKEKHIQDGKEYYSLPFMVSVPSVEVQNGSNVWKYEVEAYTKISDVKDLPPPPEVPKEPKSPPEEFPKTGDNSNAALWGNIFIMSGLCLLFCYTRKSSKAQTLDSREL